MTESILTALVGTAALAFGSNPPRGLMLTLLLDDCLFNILQQSLVLWCDKLVVNTVWEIALIYHTSLANQQCQHKSDNILPFWHFSLALQCQVANKVSILINSLTSGHIFIYLFFLICFSFLVLYCWRHDILEAGWHIYMQFCNC